MTLIQLKNLRKYLHGGHVHDAPPHIGPLAHIAPEAIGNGDFREVDVGDGLEAGVVEVLGEAGTAAARYEYLGFRWEVGEQWVSELGPLGVPLEGVFGASDGEELVPVLLACEVS